jgi:hypothetical protein
LYEAILREEAMVPGRWYGGEEPEGYDRERIGTEVGMGETDARMVGDDVGAGGIQPEDGDFDISDHLRGDEEKVSLGDAPDETMMESIDDELRAYFLQEAESAGGPPETDTVTPAPATGFYTPFDMARDHTGTDDLSSTWYRSPGRAAGGDGDPSRPSDPHAYLGFHPPKAGNDPTASPPAAGGETGTSARLAPPIWQLSAGSDTSKVLGANAKAAPAGGESGDESEEAQAGEDGDLDGDGTEDESGEGKAPGGARSGNR